MFITINGLKWKITLEKCDSNNLRRNDGSLTIGMTDKRTKTIYLCDKLNDALIYNVLVHELVHAFCFSFKIYLNVKEEEFLAEFIASYGKEIFDLTEEVLGGMIRKRIS